MQNRLRPKVNCMISRIWIILFLSTFVIVSCTDPVSVKNVEKSEWEQLSDAIVDKPNNPEVYIARANYSFNEKRDYQAALDDVKRSLVLDSSNAEVFLLEGKILTTLGESAKAKFAFLRSIELEPDHLEARLELAQYYGGLTNYDKAFSYVNEALRINQNYARAYFIKGLIYRKGGIDSLAISSLQTAAELDANTIEPYIFLGIIHGEQNNPLAVDYYNSALEIDPNNQQVIYALAYFYQENGEYRKALNRYEQLITLDEENALAYYNRGYIHLKYLDQPDSALVEFSNALEKNPKYFQAYYNRGLASEQLGDIESAKLDYKAALTLSHNYPLAIEGMNRLDQK